MVCVKISIYFDIHAQWSCLCSSLVVEECLCCPGQHTSHGCRESATWQVLQGFVLQQRFVPRMNQPFQDEASRSGSWILGHPLVQTAAWTLSILLYKFQSRVLFFGELTHKGKRTQSHTDVKIAFYSLKLPFEARFIFNIASVVSKYRLLRNATWGERNGCPWIPWPYTEEEIPVLFFTIPGAGREVSPLDLWFTPTLWGCDVVLMLTGLGGGVP